jgi:transcriptional regulator with XRE-family HTH domain
MADRSSDLLAGREIYSLGPNPLSSELGNHLGIDRGHVSESECGKRMITLDTLQPIAKAFDIAISRLLKGV